MSSKKRKHLDTNQIEDEFFNKKFLSNSIITTRTRTNTGNLELITFLNDQLNKLTDSLNNSLEEKVFQLDQKLNNIEKILEKQYTNLDKKMNTINKKLDKLLKNMDTSSSMSIDNNEEFINNIIDQLRLINLDEKNKRTKNDLNPCYHMDYIN